MEIIKLLTYMSKVFSCLDISLYTLYLFSSHSLEVNPDTIFLKFSVLKAELIRVPTTNEVKT
jgi:hypothetical protein